MALTKYLTEGLNQPIPEHANPADIALDVVNTDFATRPDAPVRDINSLASSWTGYVQSHAEEYSSSIPEKPSANLSGPMCIQRTDTQGPPRSSFRIAASRTCILMERNALNYSRNLLAYGVRLGMYCKSRATFLIALDFI